MRRFIIEVPDGRGLCDVFDEYGRCCNGLSFDELIGQVIGLAHPELGKPQYRMETVEDWAANARARHARLHADQDVVDPEVTF